MCPPRDWFRIVTIPGSPSSPLGFAYGSSCDSFACPIIWMVNPAYWTSFSTAASYTSTSYSTPALQSVPLRPQPHWGGKKPSFLARSASMSQLRRFPKLVPFLAFNLLFLTHLPPFYFHLPLMFIEWWLCVKYSKRPWINKDKQIKENTIPITVSFLGNPKSSRKVS